MGRMSIAQFGNFTAPQQIKGGGVIDPNPPLILGQWWFDFSRIAENNVNIFLGAETQLATIGSTLNLVFGIFVLPDGDVNPAGLFGLLLPDVQLSMVAPDLAFHGYNASATIANLKLKRQVILAYTFGTSGTSGLIPTVFNWRSILLNAQGV